ncbi:hypothetical protein ISN44_As11g000910, partial [Arabidopsis suecica]
RVVLEMDEEMRVKPINFSCGGLGCHQRKNYTVGSHFEWAFCMGYQIQ